MLCYILCILYVCSTCIIFICGVVLCKSVRLSYLNKGNLLRPTYLLRHSSLSGYEDGSQRSECSLLTGQKKYTLPGQRFLAATSIINEAVFCVDNVDPSVTVMICVCLWLAYQSTGCPVSPLDLGDVKTNRNPTRWQTADGCASDHVHDQTEIVCWTSPSDRSRSSSLSGVMSATLMNNRNWVNVVLNEQVKTRNQPCSANNSSSHWYTAAAAADDDDDDNDPTSESRVVDI